MSKRELRQEIIETALLLFSEKGYFNTSMQNIRKQADVSIGAIYHHFKSKEEIAAALYDEMVNWLDEALKTALLRGKTFEEQGLEITKMIMTMADEEPLKMQYIFYAKHREFMPEVMPICSSSPFKLMQNFVLEGMKQGILKQIDSVAAVSLIFGGAIRMINLKLDGVIDYELAPFAKDVWECAFRGIGA